MGVFVTEEEHDISLYSAWGRGAERYFLRSMYQLSEPLPFVLEMHSSVYPMI